MLTSFLSCRWGPKGIARMTIDIPQSVRNNAEGKATAGSSGSQKPGSQSPSQSLGSQSPRHQSPGSQPVPKTPEELGFEKFEKEIEDSGLVFDLSDLEDQDMEDVGFDDSGFGHGVSLSQHKRPDSP